MVIKRCEFCNTDYTPVQYQEEAQRYCSKQCKQKKKSQNRREHGFSHGGYNRTVYIKMWLKGQGHCYYCKIPFDVDDNWCIDHTIPRSIVKEMSKIKHDISNMQVVCFECNTRKGSLDSESFKLIIKETNDKNKSDERVT